MHKLLVVLMLLFPIGLCKAQVATAKPVEPTAIGVIYHLDPSGPELKKLTVEDAKEGLHSCGFGKGCDLVEVPGETSSFRLKTDDKFQFLFKSGSAEKVSLYRFDQKKKKRSFVLEKIAPPIYGGSEASKGLPVEVSQFGESSYQLIPQAPLSAGEYAILIAGTVYTFGVDPQAP